MNIPPITTRGGTPIKTLRHDFNYPRDEHRRLQVFLTPGDVVPEPGETVIVQDDDDHPPLRLRGRVAFMIAVIEDEEWLRASREETR